VELLADPTSISLEKMKPHRSDSYQPKASADHSNEWTLICDGSASRERMLGSSAKVGKLLIKVRASGFEEDCRAASGMCGKIDEMIVRTVCSGSSTTHDSIYTVISC
jgi:hypothetical protein